MMSSEYRRVNRWRVCRVCGKPDWCSYTPDEKVSFCARIAHGADRISRTGWGIFFHGYAQSSFRSLPFPPKTTRKKPELAPIEIRDFAYRKLIELAPATNVKEIIDGPKGLRARRILDFENYGSLPSSRNERIEIANQIWDLICREFPAYFRNKLTICGIPGFWSDKSGKFGLWTDRDYSVSMLLIPYRDANDLIQACQIRFMFRTVKDVRYVWLSTPKKAGGMSSGTQLHFASRKKLASHKQILVTEGALKAQTAQVFKPEFTVIAASGVSCSHEEIIAATRHCAVSIAFDNDYHHNRQVLKHIIGLLEKRLADAKRYGYKAQTDFLVWSEKFKGIDDALLSNASLLVKTPLEWLRTFDYPVAERLKSNLLS